MLELDIKNGQIKLNMLKWVKLFIKYIYPTSSDDGNWVLYVS